MADGVSQSMAAFKPRVSLSSGSNPNGSHASSPVNSQGPITKVILCLNGSFVSILFRKMIVDQAKIYWNGRNPLDGSSDFIVAWST